MIDDPFVNEKGAGTRWARAVWPLWQCLQLEGGTELSRRQHWRLVKWTFELRAKFHASLGSPSHGRSLPRAAECRSLFNCQSRVLTWLQLCFDRVWRPFGSQCPRRGRVVASERDEGEGGRRRLRNEREVSLSRFCARRVDLLPICFFQAVQRSSLDLDERLSLVGEDDGGKEEVASSS